jgi:hypothetical protein
MPGVVAMSPPDPEAFLATKWLDSEMYKQPDNNSPLTPADIRRAAARLFGNSAPLAVVVLGNAAELQSQLGKIELRSSAPDTKPANISPLPPKKP